MGHGRGDDLEAHPASEAVDQGGSVEHDPRRQGAQDEILQAGFGGLAVARLEGGQNVKGQRLQLDGDEQRDQVAGRNHHAHAERRDDNQHGVFEARRAGASEPAVA